MELNKGSIANLDIPETGYSFVRDSKHPGLGIRISHKGSMSWILERRVAGKNVRRTLGDANGTAALSRTEAISEFKKVDHELEIGEDKVAVKKATKCKIASSSITFGAALKHYVTTKERKGDNLSLKARTVADYLAMIEAPRKMKNGNMTKGGSLFLIAEKPLAEITGNDIREIRATVVGRRRRDYAMQVCRAVLRHNGVKLADDPFDVTAAGVKRITIASARSQKNPMTKVNLGKWWNACDDIRSKVAADALKGLLLSGCRPVEFGGDKFGNEPLLVKDVDLAGKKFTLADPKNRRKHTVFMSEELLEIVARNCKDKKPADAVFCVADLGKSMRAVCKAAGMAPEAHTPSDTRSTFGSIAATLVPHGAVQAMMNHTGGDVTTSHYVQFDADFLRQCWQQVATYVIEQSLAAKDVIR